MDNTTTRTSPWEIQISSTMDGTMQPSLFLRAEGAEKRPLLVGLHTWSADRFNQVKHLVPWAQKYNFHLLLPEFRGPNLSTNPYCTEACGSEYAKADIKDAIDFLVKTENVDPRHIFLYGESGGGHMALLMAGFIPEYFEAIAAFVSITDVKKWLDYRKTLETDIYRGSVYTEHIRACCSDDEGEMAMRSPMSYIDTIARANLKIFHGKYDSSVPYTHSVELFEAISRKYPESRVFLDVFDGGHQTDDHEALYWLLSQYEKTVKIGVTG